MKKLTDCSHQRAVRAFEKHGFRVAGGRKHIKMSNGQHTFALPRSRRLHPHLLARLVREAGLNPNAFADSC